MENIREWLETYDLLGLLVLAKGFFDHGKSVSLTH